MNRRFVMTFPYFSLKMATLSVAITVELFSISPLPIWARSINPINQSVSLNWTPPNRGTPNQTEGGASRDDAKCSEDEVKPNPPLMALMPTDSVVLTVAERPTFFIYVPKISAETAEFVLKDENEDDIYKTRVTLPEKPGIISISLPPTAKALETGKTYRWYFDLVCNSGKRLFVDRLSIQRTEPNPTLAEALKKAQPRDRPNLYAQNGIWYDTLQTLAALRYASPNDTSLAADWKQLLESSGLKAIADQPLNNCCTPESRGASRENPRTNN
jgi:Domain of Unknown Function (DUF928)